MGRKKKITSDGKVVLQILIPEELYYQVVKMAVEEYGNARGAVSWFVERAIRAYLAPRLHTQIHTNPKGKVRRAYEAVVRCLEEMNGGFKPDMVPGKQLYACISETRGSDQRTIAKWVDIFKRQGLIKDLTPANPWHRKIYEIL